eukprot:CAMPEP_0176382344 /NCGR_PEP_ID=MMETSP0126-20121128/32620_1 /TAXON_ID=141414 ORGANISM="Strombidinopsis acuminatum, Strain SPMC142" /NCGR_SAMPLE_ID=MMETSP0126 /ASSEMBLY_ACC=CAM_ASM_000229 /LENGTH=128 /DNA_ID=CAMNT_0017746739 /DNA_START=20 /DNA_END=406 /DNA_ORIENTATION=+
MPRGGGGRSSGGSRGSSPSRGSSSSGGFFNRGPSRSSAAPPRPAAAPQRQQPAAAPTQQSGGMASGLMGSLATGMAMGTGSAIAHRAIDGMMGPRGGHHQEAPMQGAADGGYNNVQQQEASFDQPDYS